jgi:hypothetical protein
VAKTGGIDDVRDPDAVTDGAGDEVALPVPAASPDAIAVVPLERGPSLPAIATMHPAEFDALLAGMALARKRIRQIHAHIMVRDVDYGTIPGTERPTLYKPGAEILLKMNRCSAKFTNVRTLGDGKTAPFITWDSVCMIVDEAGHVVAEGMGTCNTHEPKYRYRKELGGRACPVCGVVGRVVRSRYADRGAARGTPPGWFCWAKKGGCGTNFKHDDERIAKQVPTPDKQLENPDPFGLDNTVLKVAAKRALVAANLTHNAASGTWTQDAADDDERDLEDEVGVGPMAGDEPPPIGDEAKPPARTAAKPPARTAPAPKPAPAKPPAAVPAEPAPAPAAARTPAPAAKPAAPAPAREAVPTREEPFIPEDEAPEPEAPVAKPERPPRAVPSDDDIRHYLRGAGFTAMGAAKRALHELTGVSDLGKPNELNLSLLKPAQRIYVVDQLSQMQKPEAEGAV